MKTDEFMDMVPYCHFKHSKRENISDTNLISELVSKAVHKVLSNNLGSPSSDANDRTSDAEESVVSAPKNVTYNPTPIAELNKYKSQNVATENIEQKKNRHIPIQYTPERPPRPINANYSSLEYIVEDCTKTPGGYSPTPKTYSTSISYVPSSIKSLSANLLTTTSNSTSSDSFASTESRNQVYVPSNISSDPLSSSASKVSEVKYSPTRNLDTETNLIKSEYVPKYNDEFIDDFLNDPNIFEPSKIDGKRNSEAENKSKTKSSSHNHESKSDSKPKKSSSHGVSSKDNSSKSKKSESEKKSSSHSDKDKHKSKVSERSNEHNCKHKSSSDKDSQHKHKSSNDKHRSSRSNKHKSHSSKSSHSNGKSTSSDHDKTSERNRSSEHSKSGEQSKSSSRSKSKNHSKSSGRRKSKDKPNTKHKSSSSSSTDKHEETKPTKQIQESVSEDENLHFDDYISDDEIYDSTLEECKRIFEEYQPPSEEFQAKIQAKPVATEEVPTASTSKKRVAHDKSANVIREKVSKPSVVRNAAMVMANRYKAVLSTLEKKQPDTLVINNTVTVPIEPAGHAHSENHKRVLKRSFKTERIETTNSVATSQDSFSYQVPAKMKRIAHVPNVASFLNAKKKVEEISKVKEINKTPVQTVSKGSKRVAHVPEMSLGDIPSVIQVDKSKLPVNVRTRYLHLMAKECAKLYTSNQAVYERALNEEFNCYSKCTAIGTYRNSVMLSINRLRKEAESGKSANSTKDNSSEFTGQKFYDNISKWMLTKEELIENGYPQPGAPKKGYALFKDNRIIEKIPENSQLCIRCKKTYPVTEDGYPVFPEDCIYHPGSRFVFRGETKYVCCRDSGTAGGCCICPTHVFEIRDLSQLSGFVTTFDPEYSDDPKSIRVYALDCEMVYTTRGFELARVTVIDHKCEVVYESLVKPLGDILDHNTRYSGLTEEMMENVTTRITEVQATLLLMFNSKTILIGHSLESDLKAMRLIHNSVIDTSVLFPHKMGPPKKRALRGLASDYLKKIIQNSEGGHDSAEDAITCMELIMWKLKEELKLR
ncbi:uncharacterized protein CBL_13182 [Carabus blaptoides fortunei]